MSRVAVVTRPNSVTFFYDAPRFTDTESCIKWLMEVWENDLFEIILFSITDTKDADADVDFTEIPTFKEIQESLAEHRDYLSLVAELNEVRFLIGIDLSYNPDLDLIYAINVLLESEDDEFIRKIEKTLRLTEE